MLDLNKTALAFGTVLGLGAAAIAFMTSQASAAKVAKPMLKTDGMNYYAKPTAKSSAIGRWERKASASYGAQFGGWGRAKKKSVDCRSKYHQGNGKKLWTCTAKGKPVAIVLSCKSGSVKATGVKPKQKGAVKWAHRFWARGAAERYGVAYSFVKNAKNKSMKCSKVPNGIKCVFKAVPCK